MSGGIFILTINVALALTLCGGFLAIAHFDRSNVSARWFALAYGAAILTPLAEFAIAAGVMVHLAWMVSALAILAALLLTVFALAKRFGVGLDSTALVAVFAVSAVLYYFVFAFQRYDFIPNMLYQIPYAIAMTIGVFVVWKARRWGMLEIALFAVLAVSALHFIAKPFLAELTGGAGTAPEDYAGTLYAMISQSSSGILALAGGVLYLLMAGQDSLAAIVRQAERDRETGLLNRRIFEDRAGAWLLTSGETDGPREAALILCVLDPQHDPANPNAASVLADALAESRLDGTAILGRLGVTQFAAFAPDASLFAARSQAESARKALEQAGGGELGASFGVAECEAGDTLSDMLARAEWALDEARRAGGNCVRLAARGGFTVSRPNTG